MASDGVRSFLRASQDGEGWRVFHPSYFGVVYHPVFLIARKRSCFHVTDEEEERNERVKGGYRSIFREIFVDLQRHYRCGARSRQLVSSGIWRRRKRAVNPLFTRACEPTRRRSLFEALWVTRPTFCAPRRLVNIYLVPARSNTPIKLITPRDKTVRISGIDLFVAIVLFSVSY